MANHSRFLINSAPTKGNESVFASTPEGLVAIGDIFAMRKYLHMFATNDAQDVARNRLLLAGGTRLAKTKLGRVVRMRLMGWPVSVSHQRNTKVHSTMTIADSRNRNIIYKLRELWSRCLQNTTGTLICPMSMTTHIHALLSLNPVHMRDCIRHGVEMLAGAKDQTSWSFETEPGGLQDSTPDLPSAFVFGAYVCSEIHDPDPVIAMPPTVRFEMQQLVEALLTTGTGSVGSVRIGEPTEFSNAVTVAQGMQLAAMFSRSTAIGHVLDIDFGEQGDVANLSAAYVDSSTGRDLNDVAYTWCYSNVWRPRSHTAVLNTILDDERAALVAQSKRPTFDLSSIDATSSMRRH